MNIELVIYLASISQGVVASICLFGTIFLLGGLALIVNGLDTKLNSRIKKGSFILLCSAFSFLAGAFIPKEKDIYKIAGVSEQQKASIDAQGEVVKIEQAEATK